MVLTPRERAYVAASKHLERATTQYYTAQVEYKRARDELRQEYGMILFPGFGVYIKNTTLNRRVANKAARTIQRYARAAKTRRRASAASTLRKSLPNNSVRRILS